MNEQPEYYEKRNLNPIIDHDSYSPDNTFYLSATFSAPFEYSSDNDLGFGYSTDDFYNSSVDTLTSDYATERAKNIIERTGSNNSNYGESLVGVSNIDDLVEDISSRDDSAYTTLEDNVVYETNATEQSEDYKLSPEVTVYASEEILEALKSIYADYNMSYAEMSYDNDNEDDANSTNPVDKAKKELNKALNEVSRLSEGERNDQFEYKSNNELFDGDDDGGRDIPPDMASAHIQPSKTPGTIDQAEYAYPGKPPPGYECKNTFTATVGGLNFVGGDNTEESSNQHIW
ncbi:hypothetical protein ACFL0W_03545 [Nanoarchaeota archaeon]